MSKRVDAAIAEVRSLHPFPGYIDETAEEVASIVDLILSCVPLGGRLLDIGCGALDKTAVLQRLKFQCFACDDFNDPWHARSNNLTRLVDFAMAADIELHVQNEDYTIPWKHDSFDVVTLLGVIEHLNRSPRELLNVAGAFLKTGGVVIVVMPNAVNLRKRRDVVLGRTNYPPVDAMYHNIGQWRGHVREYTLQETKLIIEWTGFEIVRAETFHGMLARRLGAGFSRRVYLGLCQMVPTLKDSIFVAGRKPAGWSPRLADEDAAMASMLHSVPKAVIA